MIENIDELIAFLKQYHRPLLETEPPQLLEMPDLFVPEPLRKLYDLFGHHVGAPSGPLSTQDKLLPPAELELDGREVRFLAENQWVWTCCYDLDLPGNPVTRHDDGGEPERQTDTLEEFLITFALEEAVMSSPWLFAVDEVSTSAELQTELVALCLGGRYAYSGPNFNIRMTPDEEVLYMDCLPTGFWIASYSCEAARLLRAEQKFQVISPSDRSAVQTFVGRGSRDERPAPTVVERMRRWLRGW